MPIGGPRAAITRLAPTGGTVSRETLAVYVGPTGSDVYTGTNLAVIGANTDGVVVWGFGEDGVNSTTATCTLNSVSGTSLGLAVEGTTSSQYVAAFWWPASALPTTGSYDVVMTWSATMNGAGLYCLPFAGAAQSTPTADVVNITDATISTSLASVPAGSIVVSAADSNTNVVSGITYDGDETSLDESWVSSGGHTASASYEEVASTQTVVHSRTLSGSQRQAMISVRIDPA